MTHVQPAGVVAARYCYLRKKGFGPFSKVDVDLGWLDYATNKVHHASWKQIAVWRVRHDPQYAVEPASPFPVDNAILALDRGGIFFRPPGFDAESLYFARNAGPVEKLPPPAPAQAEWRGCGTVLVADDEEAVRIVASRLLKTFGYEVTLAVNGREAVEKFREARSDYAAVLLDLTMPQMDGTEAFAELRRIKPEIKVVLMSGFNEQDAISRFAGKGLAAFVQKPFTPDELRTAFQKLPSFSA